ncbi:MAG: permease, partial [Allobranchiibius sp.]
ELVIGFAVAGFLAALVPNAFWQSLFLTGHGFWSSLENVVLGPFLAIISFVCSVGNVPLAAALWQGGISFGGVVAFVFADLITLPLLGIYRKYFGTAITVRILGTFWATMSIAGLAVEYLFRVLSIPDPVRPTMVVHTGFQWNYTSILNIIALVAFAVLYWLYRHRDTTGPQRYAKDPMCGMQVEIAHAPATRTRNGEKVYFCSDHCAHRFNATASDELPTSTKAVATAIDPVCGMTVDTSTALQASGPGGSIFWFCSEGCRKAFVASPEQFTKAGDAASLSGGSHKHGEHHGHH